MHSVRIIQGVHTERQVMYDQPTYSSLMYVISTSCKYISNVSVLYCTLALVFFFLMCLCVCVCESESVSQSLCVYNAGAVICVYFELRSVVNIKNSTFALTNRLMITYCS